MPKWVLQCPNCKTEFQHSQISDVGMASYFDPPKPKVPPAGIECVCPSCGNAAVYLRTDLMYRP